LSLAWNATVVDTFAPNHYVVIKSALLSIHCSNACHGHQMSKYNDLLDNYCF